MTAICTVLSFFFHPGSKNEWYISKQMLVSFTMYMEAIGLLPQIYLIRKHKEVEAMTGHYMFCLAVSRFLRLIFWLQMFWDGDWVGYLVIADLIHTLLLSDFTYFYIKQARQPCILL